MMKRQLTQLDHQRIRHWFKADVPRKEIARRLGLHYNYVCVLVKKLCDAKDRFTDPKFKRVCELYARGEKVENIATEVGVGISTVSRWAREGKIAMRSRGYRPPK